MSTKMDTCDNFSYMFINIVGEVGEFASKIAKAIRKGQLVINGSRLQQTNKTPSLLGNELRKEAGDIFWQFAGLCDSLGWRLEDVATENLEKLASRKQRGVIDGNGDNR